MIALLLLQVIAHSTPDHHVQRPGAQTRVVVVFSCTREDLGQTKEGNLKFLCCCYMLGKKGPSWTLSLGSSGKSWTLKMALHFKGLTYTLLLGPNSLSCPHEGDGETWVRKTAKA